MDKYLVIALGGGLGACARYGLGVWANDRFGANFPYGTLLINISGSFVLGLFLTLTAGRLPVDPGWRLLFATGFLGAYTTFSTYTFESVQLILAGQWQAGLVNLVASNLLGLGAVVLGIALGQRL